jgi:hypothetical protein
MKDIFKATIKDSTSIHGGDYDIIVTVHFELQLIDGQSEAKDKTKIRGDIEVLNIFQYHVSMIESSIPEMPNIEGGEEILYLCCKDIKTLLNNYIDEHFEYYENKLNN